jgi:acetyltransferase-like isoleucine patch superfamily enzyme
MSKPIIFLGSSLYHLGELADLCDVLNIAVAGIIDSDYYGNTEMINDIPVIGSEKTADFETLKKTHDFFIAILPSPNVPRNIQKRRMFVDLVDQYDLPCPALVDPSIRLGKHVKFGKGVYVGWMSSVQSHVTLHDHCQIHGMSAIGHNATVGKNTVLQRQVMIPSGSTVGENSYLGLYVKCLQPSEMKIGSNVLIHPGVIVMRDIEDDEVVTLTGKSRRNKVYNPVILD